MFIESSKILEKFQFQYSSSESSYTNGNEYLFNYAPTDAAYGVSSGWDSKIFTPKIKDLNVSTYVWSPIKDNKDAIKKSHSHLIDLIRYYEGDPKNNYNAKSHYNDKNGVRTYGYGVTKMPNEQMKPCNSDKEAYDLMLRYMDEVAFEDVIKVVGEDLYKAAPASVREALLDYAFKNGRTIMHKFKGEFVEALSKKDWPKLLEILVYGKSVATGEKDAGIYRRSLSRAILATRDLPYSQEIKDTIAKIYSEAVGQAKAEFGEGTDKYNNFCRETKLIHDTYIESMNSKQVVSESSKTYTVPKEMSLYSLATAIRGNSKVPVLTLVETLAELNNIKFSERDKNGFPKTGMLKVGNNIKVPSKIAINGATVQLAELKSVDGWKEVAVVQDNQKANTYTVQQGDGYLAIVAKVYPKVTEYKDRKKIADELEKFNNIPNDTLKSGMVINLLPEGDPIFANQKQIPVESSSTKKVQENSATTSVALEEEQKPLTRLQLMNKELYKKEIKFKYTLKDGIKAYEYTHKIKTGETLYSLGIKYGIAWQTLQEYNNIKDPSSISFDQEIKIPKVTYQVKTGDNLSSIAKKLGISTEILMDTNGIENPNSIKAGDIYELPGYVYKVKSGDTISKISCKADKAGLKVPEGKNAISVIKSLNGLKDNTIYPNQNILILFGDADYAVDKSRKRVVKGTSGEVVSEITMSSATGKKERTYISKKKKVNGKVVPNEVVFNPTAIGDLNEKTVIVNAGHGYSEAGIDPGAAGKGGLEDEWLINYDNAMILKDELVKRGAKVIFVQGGVRIVGDWLKKQKLDSQKTFFISIHVNSSGATEINDRMEIFYQPYAEKGKVLAKKFENNIDHNVNSGKKDGYTSSISRNYHVTKIAKSKGYAAILWEVAFMNSKSGRGCLINPVLIKKYSKQFADAVRDCN